MSKPYEDFANKTVNNPLYREMKLAILEDSRTWVPNPANPEVGFGLFQGVMRTFEQIESMGTLEEPKKSRKQEKGKSDLNPEPDQSSDPDFQ